MINKKVEEFNFTPIKPIFDAIIEKSQNKLEREKVLNDDEIQKVLLAFVKRSIDNSQAILLLCDVSQNEKVRLYLNCPALIRSLFDLLFQLLFLLEDNSEFTKYFYKVRLRELREKYEIYKKQKGKSISAEQQIDDLENEIIRLGFGLTDNQKKDFKKLPKAESFNTVNTNRIKNISVKKVSDYLANQYPYLSQLTHYQPTGVIESTIFFNQSDKAKLRVKIDTEINNFRWTTLNLFLCLFSEIEINHKLGLKDELLTMWLFLLDFSDETKLLFGMRYREFLNL
jgi:hypothetical protein